MKPTSELSYYSITQATKEFGVPRSALCQAITYGQVKTVLKVNPNHTKAGLRQTPMHHIDRAEMVRFRAVYRSPDYNAPGFLADLRSTRHNARRAALPMSAEERATHAARDVIDDRRAACDLGMTLAEYRGVAL